MERVNAFVRTHLSDYRLMGRFIIGGGSAAFTQVSLLYILTDVVGVWYLLSSVLAFVAAVAVSFSFQKFWTFKDRTRERTTRQFVGYFLFQATALAVNAYALYVLVELLAVWYILAQILISGVIALLSFFVYKLIIFPSDDDSVRRRLLALVEDTRLFLARHSTEVLIVLFIIALRLVAFHALLSIEDRFVYPLPEIEVDAREYYQIAVNLVDHGAFSLQETAPFVSDSFRTPVYPLFIALSLLLFNSPYVVLVFQAILAGFVGVLVMHLASRFISRRTGIAAALLFGLEPTGIFFSNVLMTETLFLILLLSALLLLYRRPDASGVCALSGALLGLATLTRPIGLLLPAALVITYLVWVREVSMRRRMLNMALLCVAFAAIVFPWTLRNRIAFGVFDVASVGSYNLYFYNAKRFYMHKTGASFEEAAKVFDERIVQKYGREALAPSLRYAAVQRREGLAIIADDPLAYARFHLGTLIPFFFTDGVREVGQTIRVLPREFVDVRSPLLRADIPGVFRALQEGGWLSVLLVLGAVFWGAIFCLMLFGAWRLFRLGGEKRFVAASMILVLFLLALLSGVVTTARFRYAASPFMFLLAMYGFEYSAALWKTHRARQLAAVIP